jgi:hypothetical protein
MLTFDNLVSVTFQGTVIVFGHPTSGATSDIWFNVLGQNVDANDTELYWGFTRLEPSAQVREVGISDLSTPGRPAIGARHADGEPLQAVVGQIRH